jgi:tetratricopeptide (TPR) repeat protein
MNRAALDSPDRAYQEILRNIRTQDWRAAEQACLALTGGLPSWAAGWEIASVVALRTGRAREALLRVERALKIDAHEPRCLIQRARCLLALGQLAQACELATQVQRQAGTDPALWDAIGGLFNMANEQQRALAAYDRAVTLAPDNAHFLFNRAAVRRFVGELDGAEADYDRVIQLRPDDYEAYKNRADLRAQSLQRNHTAQLESLLAKPLSISDRRGEVQLRYALAKEYEDLGQYERSFHHLALGAQRQRERLRYDIENDIATVDWIIEAYPQNAEEPAGQSAGAATPQASAESPVFILGLPRCGTTLVDRILGSHSMLVSAGELNHFALALVAAVRRQSGPGTLSRRELVARSAQLDFAALGLDYLARARNAGVSAARFTDKMPLNYLYCGLIRRALPNARIVHLTRHPMAVCYAMYKTLFEDGYPFSYDLQEIGRYYIAYRRLMAHWQRTMPGMIHEVRYESLVADQRGETRRLLEFCGLPWEEACVEFHRNPTATTTASASQVRRQVYDTSVSQWRHYECWLAPLRAQLESAGIELNEVHDGAPSP